MNECVFVSKYCTYSISLCVCFCLLLKLLLSFVLRSAAGNGNNDWCNTFDFILGLLVIGTLPDKLANTSASSPLATIETGLSILSTYNYSYAAFNADWAPVVRAQLSRNRDTQFLRDAFVHKNRSLISIRSISSNLRIISEHAYELSNGSCNGALTDILSNWFAIHTYMHR